MRPIECGGCRKCCLGDTVYLKPGDNPLAYQTSITPHGLALKKGADGNCVYLGPQGCKIHGRQPVMCRLYDCRVHAVAAAQDPKLADRESARAPLAEGIARLSEERKLSGPEEKLRRHLCG